MSTLKLLSGALTLLFATVPAPAQTLSGQALLQALRHGGYVIVMRHASSPRETPSKQIANPDNVTLERQLDEVGRTTAAAMGKALRDLKIPVGDVFTSPTYRALETIRLEQWPNPKPAPELGDNGRSMQGGTEAQAAWLRNKVTQFPSRTNTILVTHLPNLTGAFPSLATGVEDGEALIFGPDGKGGATLVARVKIQDWPALTR
jgi:phosphohistidine phosphatase SixA